MQFKYYFVGEAPEHKNEALQFVDLAKRLEPVFGDNTSSGRAYLLGNLKTATCELDAVLITNKLVLGLEFKNYQGKVDFGLSKWMCGDVVMKGGSEVKTPFMQSKTNRASLIGSIKILCGKEGLFRDSISKDARFPFVAYWVVVYKNISFDENDPIYQQCLHDGVGQIPWFRLSYNEKFVQDFNQFFKERKEVWSDDEVEKIVASLCDGAKIVTPSNTIPATPAKKQDNTYSDDPLAMSIPGLDNFRATFEDYGSGYSYYQEYYYRYKGTIRAVLAFLYSFLWLNFVGNAFCLCSFEPEIVKLGKYVVMSSWLMLPIALSVSFWPAEWRKKFKYIKFGQTYKLPERMSDISWTNNERKNSFFHFVSPFLAWSVVGLIAYYIEGMSSWRTVIAWTHNSFPTSLIFEVASKLLMMQFGVCAVVFLFTHIASYFSSYIVCSNVAFRDARRCFWTLFRRSFFFACVIVLPSCWWSSDARYIGSLGVVEKYLFSWNYAGPTPEEKKDKADDKTEKKKKEEEKKQKSKDAKKTRRNRSGKSEAKSTPVKEDFLNYTNYNAGTKLPVKFSSDITFSSGSSRLSYRAEQELKDFAKTLQNRIDKGDLVGKTVVVGIYTSEEPSEAQKYGKQRKMIERAAVAAKVLREAGLRCQIVFLDIEQPARAIWLYTSIQ